MSSPIIVDLPHNLGAEEARRRIQGGIGKLKDHVPGGSAEVRSSWNGDRMSLNVQAMGQEVDAHIDVQEKVVRVEVLLPPMLGFFGRQIEGLLRKQGARMLEDKSMKD
ncbi:MAG TPA: polyhydroxyalkanoic acid system family protein [Allosphingosinicella sp.]|nr:polyhydroxyalkanoic acid system family protein [Allosphingosinicella sp.]